MLRTITTIRGIVDKVHPAGHLPYKIKDIASAVKQCCGVDRIEYIQFTDADNPIVGRYEKYVRPFGVYGNQETKVDVYYSDKLNYCKRRFVICKEICQALDGDPLAQVNTPEQMERLVQALRLSENERHTLLAFQPYRSEQLAAFHALELLCPVRDRRKLLKVRKDYSDMSLATEFRIPVMYIDTIFNEKYIDVVEK